MTGMVITATHDDDQKFMTTHDKDNTSDEDDGTRRWQEMIVQLSDFAATPICLRNLAHAPILVHIGLLPP